MPTDYSHTLYQNDLNDLVPGIISSQGIGQGGFSVPYWHPSWEANGCFKVIERGMGKYIETLGGSPFSENRLLLVSDTEELEWNDYRVRAVMTPLSFEDASPKGGLCGVVGRYQDCRNYVALVLDRDGRLQLLQRRDGSFHILDSKPIEFCLGQSLTLMLAFEGTRVLGTAGPYSGPTQVQGSLLSSAQANCVGKAGFIADVHTRFGPLHVECSVTELERLRASRKQSHDAVVAKRARYSKMKMERTVPLRNLVSGPNLRVADVNGDGVPEIIVAQSSKSAAAEYSMTRLTCISVLDIEGSLLWQAGVPANDAAASDEELPFEIHDLYGDGSNVIVCVFGYDLQIRDGRTGKVLFSAATPETFRVGADFKELTSNFGSVWGDETLNMNVAELAFCNTQGNGGAREILVKDDLHNLAVLDGFSLQVLFRHRGNHARKPLIGDFDGDSKTEILAGYSMIDDDGKSRWSVPLGGRPQAVAALAEQFAIASDSGLYLVNDKTARESSSQFRVQHGEVERLSVAKFRSDLPGVQLATSSRMRRPGILSLHDGSGRKLWSRELQSGAAAIPVKWNHENPLLLASMRPGSGLFDGYGECAVEAPTSGPSEYCAVTRGLNSDAVIAWDATQLVMYAPA